MKLVKFMAVPITIMLLTQPIIAPDSPLYPLKKIIEELDILLTFDDVSKASKLLKYARERLEDAEIMVRKGKYDYVKGLLKDYNDYIERVMSLIESGKNSEKIAGMLINETLSDIKILLKLGYEDEALKTIKMDEKAVKIIKNENPSKACKLNLELVKGILEVSNGRKSLLEECDRMMKESLKIKSKSKDLFETIKEIIDEATNLSLIEKPEDRNVTTDIIEKGLEIYKKLGVDSFIR